MGAFDGKTKPSERYYDDCKLIDQWRNKAFLTDDTTHIQSSMLAGVINESAKCLKGVMTIED